VAAPRAALSQVTFDGALFDYAPPLGFFGKFAFGYTACDDSQPAPLCDNTTVTIIVEDPKGPKGTPIAVSTRQAVNVTLLGDPKAVVKDNSFKYNFSLHE
jgi:hypothetical protein